MFIKPLQFSLLNLGLKTVSDASLLDLKGFERKQSYVIQAE